MDKATECILGRAVVLPNLVRVLTIYAHLQVNIITSFQIESIPMEYFQIENMQIEIFQIESFQIQSFQVETLQAENHNSKF